MFSPEASSLASIRSARTRRRQRNDSDGSQQQQRSRKRSKLNNETFKDPAGANGNGSALMNGHAVQSVGDSAVLVDIPLVVREKKTAPKRALKEDTGTYLVRRYASVQSIHC